MPEIAMVVFADRFLVRMRPGARGGAWSGEIGLVNGDNLTILDFMVFLDRIVP